MIYVDESTVKIDKTVLPGLFKKIEVKGDAIVDEQAVQGQTKKPKQATGFKDIKVNIELILEDGPKKTKMEKLADIQNLFRKPGQSKPEVHELINEHTAIRGVKKVIFKNLSHSQENKRDQITVNMEFWEYTVMTITATKSTKSAKDSAAAAAAASLNSDYQSYLENRGGGSDRFPGSGYRQCHAVCSENRRHAIRMRK